LLLLRLLPQVVFLVACEDGLLPLLKPETSTEELEEEARLAFVGMTRARDWLHMSRSRRVVLGYGRDGEWHDSEWSRCGAGCWLLAGWLLSGCWLLAAGCWLLAAGCWLAGCPGCMLIASMGSGGPKLGYGLGSKLQPIPQVRRWLVNHKTIGLCCAPCGGLHVLAPRHEAGRGFSKALQVFRLLLGDGSHQHWRRPAGTWRW
jgi:hypothetical protein